MHPQQGQVQQLSNNMFVAGGIYPGGTGRIIDIRYKLWDYNGTMPPNSQCAVYVQFQPLDGSNDGKTAEIYWGVGPASDFQPDHTGGFLLSSSRQGISNQCNWHQIHEALINTCGLDGNRLDTPGQGIRVLLNGEMTVVRADPKARDFGDKPGQQGQQGQGQQKRVNQILVPTRFRGAWEMGGMGGGMGMGMPGGMPMPMQMPPSPQMAPPQMVSPPQFAGGYPQQAPPPMPMGGGFAAPPMPAMPNMAMPTPAPTPTPNGAVSSVAVLQAVMQRHRSVSIADGGNLLSKHALDEMVAVDPLTRVNILNEIKNNLPAIAAAAGVANNGQTLSVG